MTPLVNFSNSTKVVNISANVNLALKSAVSVVFGARPKALEDGTQGDHATAYALYESWLMTTIKECMINNENVGSHEWVYELTTKMQAKLEQERNLQSFFQLENASTLDLDMPTVKNVEFSVFSEMANDLPIMYAQDEIIKSLIAHKSRVEKDLNIPEDFKIFNYSSVDEYKKRQLAFLDEQINQRKIIFATNIAQAAAEAFLRAKNSSKMVAFKQIPGRDVDTKQGGRITGALKALDGYVSGNEQSIEPSEDEEGEIEAANIDDEIVSSSATSLVGEGQNLRRSTRQNLGKPPERLVNFVEPETPQKIANKLAREIVKLLDFKKLSSDELTSAYRQKLAGNQVGSKLVDERFRTNDKKILNFVIANHLATVFEAFPEITKNNEIKKLVVKAVIKELKKPQYAGKKHPQWDDTDIAEYDIVSSLDSLFSEIVKPINTVLLNPKTSHFALMKDKSKNTTKEPINELQTGQQSSTPLRQPPISPNLQQKTKQAAAASLQRRINANKSPNIDDLKQRDLGQLKTPTKSDPMNTSTTTKKSNSLPLWPIAAQASAERRKKDDAAKVENNQNKKNDTEPPNTSPPNKKGTFPS